MKNIIFLNLLVFSLFSCGGGDDSQDIVPQNPQGIAEEKEDKEEKSDLGNNGNTSQNTIILTGDITNQEAQNLISDTNLNLIKNIIIKGTTELTLLEIPTVTEIIDLEISNNEKLTSISLPNLTLAIGDLELLDNNVLTQITVPVLKRIGSLTVISNEQLTQLNLEIEEVIQGNIFIDKNDALFAINFLNLESNQTNDSAFLTIVNNKNLQEINVPFLKILNSLFLNNNTSLKTFDFTNLEELETFSFFNNTSIEKIKFPSLDKPNIFSNFPNLSDFPNLQEISFEKLKTLNNLNIRSLNSLTTLNFPALETINGDLDISNNNLLTNAVFSNTENVGSINIENNSNLTSINFSSLKQIEEECNITKNSLLTNIQFPVLKQIGNNFTLSENNAVITLEFPNLENIGLFKTTTSASASLLINRNLILEKISFPKLKKIERLISTGANLRLKTINLDLLESTENLFLGSKELGDYINFQSINISSLKDFSRLNILYPLTTANTDAILEALVSNNVTGKTMDINGTPSSGSLPLSILRINNNITVQ